MENDPEIKVRIRTITSTTRNDSKTLPARRNPRIARFIDSIEEENKNLILDRQRPRITNRRERQGTNSINQLTSPITRELAILVSQGLNPVSINASSRTSGLFAGFDEILNNSLHLELPRNENITLLMNVNNLNDATTLSNLAEKDCSICRENYKLGETVATLNCLHRFHENCIREWGYVKTECPLCRTPIDYITR